MAYKALTEQGKAFIRNICKGTGNSLLQGKSPEKINDKSDDLYNPNGILPFCYPETDPSKIWYSNAKDNSGKLITTNQQLGEALIYWFDKYGNQYQMDANIIAAQAYVESNYKIWTYPLTSTASGISQFIMKTVYGRIIMISDFTSAEKNALTVGWSGSITDENTWGVNGMNQTSKKNRPFLHQNICNNPEIMIKAQFSYMKYISDKYTKGIASSTLFAYNRGESLCSPSYSTSIQKAAVYIPGKDYEMEGVNYVLKIFNLLGKNGTYGYFGYDNLGMNKPFNAYDAEVAETALRGS